MRSIDSVAILGGGPASSTLGTLLAQEGTDVVVYHQPTDRPIAVGESLVPGVIPILRDLGVEDAVESFSRLKPGAGFSLDPETTLEYPFAEIPGTVEDYAYNVPRKQFNRQLRECARSVGVEYVEAHAEVEGDAETLRLTETSRNRSERLRGHRPDFLVDATGRARLFASVLELPSRRGPRTDTALFTHFDSLPGLEDGTVFTDLLEYGWCWRIPLPDCDSFGVVMDSDRLESKGRTPEEQLETLMANNPRIRERTRGARRTEPVFSFSNYQLVTERLYGSNWALAGDAAGFIDPVFSTGLYLGMDGAIQLATALGRETDRALERYQTKMLDRFRIWFEIIERFYDGRLMALLKTGRDVRDSWLGGLINPHMEKHFGRIFTGRAAESRYGIWLLKFMCNHGLKDNDPETYRLRSKETRRTPAVSG